MSNGDDGGLRDNAAAARQSSLLSRPQTQPSLQSIFQPLLHASSFPTSLRPSLARAGIHGPQHSDKIILPDYGSRLACRDVRMLAMFYSIQWPLKLPRKFSPKLRSRGLYIHMKHLRNIGKVCGARKQSGLYRLQGARSRLRGSMWCRSHHNAARPMCSLFFAGCNKSSQRCLVRQLSAALILARRVTARE